jgi:hypothetical protein
VPRAFPSHYAMARPPWTTSSSNRQTGEGQAMVALVLAFLTVSWLPLSVRALSGAWSALHPASVGHLVRSTTESAPRPAPTSWPIPWKSGGCWLASSLGVLWNPCREHPAVTGALRRPTPTEVAPAPTH